MREAERAAVAFQKEAVGRLRVSSTPDLGPDHLIPAIAKFLQMNPGLSIDLDLSLATVNLVDEKFDLAIRGTISLEPNVVTRQIGGSPILVCASRTYIERHGMPQHPGEMSKHVCLHFSKLRWGRVWHFKRGDIALRVPEVPRLECNNGRSLLAAAISGMGIVLEPAFVVDRRSGQGNSFPS